MNNVSDSLRKIDIVKQDPNSSSSTFYPTDQCNQPRFPNNLPPESKNDKMYYKL